MAPGRIVVVVVIVVVMPVMMAVIVVGMIMMSMIVVVMMTVIVMLVIVRRRHRGADGVQRPAEASRLADKSLALDPDQPRTDQRDQRVADQLDDAARRRTSGARWR